MESNLNKYKLWLDFLSRVEAYFDQKGFLRVRTPNLVPSGAMEASLYSLKVEKEPYFLPTSPEFALKKLWHTGLAPKIYEISPSYRARELGNLHLTEFTMLELYESEIDLNNLIELAAAFLTKVLNLESTCKILNLNALFLAFTGFALEPESDVDFLKSVLSFHSLDFPETASWTDLYHIVYLNKIEPLLSKSSLIVLKNYPPQLAALAKINQSGWAERAEFFYKGVELGNAYDELFDLEETKLRWEKENQICKEESEFPHPIDEVFLKTLSESKVKSGAGVAIGLERVFSLTQDQDSTNIKVWPF